MTTLEAPAISKNGSAGATIVNQPLAAIVPNRYQKRAADAGLAENIREHGLKQIPVGRWHPDKPGVIELADGHRRLAAFQLLSKTHPLRHVSMPVAIQALTDRELYEACVIANEQRAPLSAIERAVTLRDYIAEFHVSQAEAGKLFTDEHGKALTQSGVSHLIRLLGLPAPIQAHVATGELPQALAREIIPLAKVFPQDALKLAEKVSKAEPADKADVANNTFGDVLRKRAKWFHHDVPWALDWPAEPIVVEGHKSITSIPACTGCQFYVKREYGSAACLRPECFELKWKYAVVEEVTAACKKLKIGISAGDPTVLVYDGDSRQGDLARAALATDRTLLRLAPHAKGNHDYGDYNRRQLLGSEHVELRTVNLPGLKQQIAALPKAQQPAPEKKTKPYDYKAKEAKRQAEAKEIERLIKVAAPFIARAVPWRDAITRVLWDVVSEMWGDLARWKRASTPVQRSTLLIEALLGEKNEGGYAMRKSSIQHARETVAEVAKAFGAKLPQGWDTPAQAPPPEPKPAAKPAHVHGHTIGHSRPAPKPSQLKKRKTSQKGKAQ